MKNTFRDGVAKILDTPIRIFPSREDAERIINKEREVQLNSILNLLKEELEELTELDSDTKCDLIDAVNELHPNLNLKLQNTISNLVDQTVKETFQHTIKELKEKMG